MIYAKFNSTVTNVITNSVTQWDYGRTLRIDGLNLPTAIRIDFCISGEETTTSRIGTTKDNVTDVVIPDSLLEQSQTIVAYVYLNDTTTGKTVRTITILCICCRILLASNTTAVRIPVPSALCSRCDNALS